MFGKKLLPVLILLAACSGGPPTRMAGNVRPADTVMDQFYRTEAGCTYARAQSVGYAATWHIVANPVRLGYPANPPGCQPIL